MSFQIVRASENTVVDAVEIIEEYYDLIGVVLRDNREKIVEYVTDIESSAIWLAYDEKGELGGVVMMRALPEVSTSAVEVKRLYVRPHMRGKGVANGLMRALEEKAKALGKSHVYLDTKDDLIDAIRFYERCGYAPCDRYNDNPQATIFMRKCIV